MSSKKVIIIGAGLSGLTAAYLLKKAGINALILEGRSRTGGRIYTLRGDHTAPVEAGATRLGKKHVHLTALLKELQLDIFPQHYGRFAVYEPSSLSAAQVVKLPPDEQPIYRVKGGTSTLTEALAARLDKTQIQLDQTVKTVNFTDTEVIVRTQNAAYTSDVLISTLPPFLSVKSIGFFPLLPQELTDIAEHTHTWMADSIKVALTYRKPFWRSGKTSGTIVSNVGPITEMYDHSDATNERYALQGFMNGSFYSVTKEQRKQLVLSQLEDYYGTAVKDYVNYEEAVWRKEPLTFAEYDTHILPHENNGHPALQKAYFNGRFYLAGAETASSFPGYMDGAVESASRVCRLIISRLTD